MSGNFLKASHSGSRVSFFPASLLTLFLTFSFFFNISGTFLFAAETLPTDWNYPQPETSSVPDPPISDPGFPQDSLMEPSTLSAADPAADMPDISAPIGSVTGPMQTLNPDYKLNLYYTDDTTPVWMRYTTDLQTWQWNGWQAYSNEMSIHEDQPLGTNLRLAVQVCDANWNCSSSETSVHYGSTMAPMGSVSGPMYILNSPLNLDMNFTDPDNQNMKMRYSTDFRNTSTPAWSSYVDYNSSYTIPESRPFGSNLPILVQVCDESWNCSTSETTVHFGSMAPPTGNIYTNEMYPESGNVTLQVDFTDGDSTSLQMRYSTDATQLNPTWSSYQPYSNTLGVSLPYTPGGSSRVWVQVCDESWNCYSAETTILFGPMQAFLPPIL